MTSRRNPDVVPRYDDDDDRPDDERLSLGAMTEDGRSVSSHRTYVEKKDSSSKRTAFRAPSAEPDRKSSHFQPSTILPSSTSSLPPRGDWRQSRNQATAGSSQLLLGFSQNNIPMPPTSGMPSDDLSFLQASNNLGQSYRRQPPISKPPPGLNRSTSRSSYSVSGKFDDASNEYNSAIAGRTKEPEKNIPHVEQETIDLLGTVLGTVSILSPTTISSLTPQDLPIQGTPTVASNLSMSDIGSVRDENPTENLSNPRSGNPRSVLNERYQKKHNRPFTKSDFVTIRDASDGDHIPTFTSMFVCPQTGECFLSGDYLQADFVLQRDGFHWYRVKKTAEFAAAGRAEDCFRFRSGECGRSGLVQQFCADPPFPERSRDEEQEEIASFLGLRACDANARDKVIALRKKRTS